MNKKIAVFGLFLFIIGIFYTTALGWNPPCPVCYHKVSGLCAWSCSTGQFCCGGCHSTSTCPHCCDSKKCFNGDPIFCCNRGDGGMCSKQKCEDCITPGIGCKSHCDPLKCETCDGDGHCLVCNGDPNQGCCNGTCYDRDANEDCCGGKEIYNTDTQKCCGNGALDVTICDINEQCCYGDCCDPDECESCDGNGNCIVCNGDPNLTCRNGHCCPKPNPNGCSWSPEDPAGCGTTSFHNACNAHDTCYQTCGSDKGGCDNAFLNALTAVCASVPPGECRDDCIYWAAWYVWAVEEYGEGAYEDDQIIYCDCD